MTLPTPCPFQVPPVERVGRAGGGARHRCCINFGSTAGAFVVWGGAVLVHGGLLVAWPGFVGLFCLVSAAGELTGAGFTVAVGAGDDHTRDPHDSHISAAGAAVITAGSWRGYPRPGGP